MTQQVPGQVQLNRLGIARLESVDMLRGFVIALMVLDHVRDYFHVHAFVFDPLDPARTSVALYATRWITHLCAPTFVFLSGVSIHLQRAQGKDTATLSRFLVSRGLWLVLLEFTLISFGFNFGFVLFAQVIYAIGIGMILLAALIRLPDRVVLAIGFLIVAGHNALVPIDAQSLGSLAVLWRAAFEPGLVSGMPGFVAYPFIPWFGIMCVGYGLGSLFLQPEPERRRSTILAGAGALVLFVVIRLVNGYGDQLPWREYETNGRTLLSFFNVSKYPPSLLYVLATLGVSLLLMPLLERLRGTAASALLAFGRTPLFTYLLHVYIVHGSALLIGVALGFPANIFCNFIVDPSRLVQAGWGFGLGIVYIVWFGTLATLYPLSRWFAGVKRRRRDAWLSYI